ncbi:hypothetical protein [Cardinium endosymbiont of Tipula unca]|uniref:hypothetical protein n=1 Tax=Cardinium endosymbiont of Tipula unca TaxID=3066216 RepID=UPI0030D1B147
MKPIVTLLSDFFNFRRRSNDYIMDYDPYSELMGITIEGFEATGIVGDENVLRVGILPQARELVANRNRQRAEQEKIKRRLALEMDRVEKENPDRP